MPIIIAIVTLIVAFIIWKVWSAGNLAKRAEFIRTYTLPTGLYDKLRKKHPQLSLKDCQLVGQALRQFFLAYLKSGRQFVAMPSQGVDDLWHEFILYTRHYDAFCSRAFGRFLHHTPAVVLSDDRKDNTGLRRVWWYACREENIDPKHPTRLPLLFAIDKKLGIAGGFVYAPDCKALQGQTAGGGSVHCGADFGSGGGDGSSDGFGDASSDGGDSGGGCGGGCGGGGD
jgi:hypothetical protein